jgi:hypothetical protein
VTSEGALLFRVSIALKGPIRGLVESRPVEIPDEFRDDGCTGWFDSLFGYDFKDVCRVHDWAFCTRCHPPGSMTFANMVAVNRVLSEELAYRLPWWLDWTAGAVYRATYLFGPFNAYDSCGPEAGERCRHNMAPPSWMLPPPKTLLGDGGADF